jgi:EmrB/QacA subfamily drug resistance transporter
VTIATLRDATSEPTFGGKASALARAMGAGLPVPDGFAVSWEAVAAGSDGAVLEAWRALGADRVAVRSSAVGEDSAGASFAGQHLTLLNVTSETALLNAVRAIRDSALGEGVLEYRKKMGIAGEPRIAIVVQRMVDAAVAGVLFTRDPITGAEERLIESAWGLGEAVVEGLVTPDRYRLTVGGQIVERTAGKKDFVVRFGPDGGTVERPVPPDDITRLSLSDPHVMALHRLAARCEDFFGRPQDIEFAFDRDGALLLLQSRPITVQPAARSMVAAAAPQVDQKIAPVAEAAADTLPLRRFTGLALAALLAPLNSTIIAVALPSISGAFHTSPAIATRWLVTAYLVVTIVAQSPAGKLADLWGTSPVLTLGRTMFGVGALMAALSPSLAVLGAGRVLMAIGGALTIPTVFAALRNSVPSASRGRVFGIFGAIMSGAAAVGPILGGFLTTRFGWHSVFIVNVPVVLLSFLLEPPRRASTVAPKQTPSFDILGSALLGIAVLFLVGTVNGSPWLAIGAAAAVAAFIARELRAESPVLDLRLFAVRPFAAGSAIIALQNLAMYSMLFLLPFFLAHNGGSPSATGRMLLLFTLGMVLASPLGGRISDRIGPRTVALAGGLTAAAGAAWFVAGGTLIPSLIAMGIGIGITTSPSQAAALSAIDGSQAGVASGALSTMRYAGGIIGSGITALLASGGLTHDARLIVFPAVLFASALAALALPGRRAA